MTAHKLHATVRLGRLKSARPVKIKLTDFVDVKAVLPKVPASDFGAARQVADWGVYANDSLGDCVIARAQHMHDLWERNTTGKAGLFSDATAIKNYSAVTGYKPGHSNTDQGTDPEAMAAYHRKTGIVDVHGKHHKIGAYCELDPGNWDHYLVASYLFEGVSVCMDFRSYMMDQFNAGNPWDYQRGGSDEGGHDTLGCGRIGTLGQTITWGKAQGFTQRWYEHLSDQALAFISPEMLKGGKTVEGFDAKALSDALASVTKAG